MRQWSVPYPELPRNKWAWSIRDSLEKYSTDGKLREDVRRNTGIVMTKEERDEMRPLADQVQDGIKEETKERPLKEVYGDVEKGIKTGQWKPEPAFTAEDVKKVKPVKLPITIKEEAAPPAPSPHPPSGAATKVEIPVIREVQPDDPIIDTPSVTVPTVPTVKPKTVADCADGTCTAPKGRWVIQTGPRGRQTRVWVAQ